ncbi:MAG: hypothetical protein ACYTXE_44565 [Nostoc sp.]
MRRHREERSDRLSVERSHNRRDSIRAINRDIKRLTASKER